MPAGMKVLLIFLDGVGISTVCDNSNPFMKTRLNIFPKFLSAACELLAFNGFYIPADASLGIDGIPQSATGQTALLTGVNAPEILGYHLYGFPNKALKHVLEKENIFIKLKNIGKKAAFANTYSPPFLEDPLKFPHSATTISAVSAGIKLNTFEELAKGESLYHDFTNSVLVERGYDVNVKSPEEAGKMLSEILKKSDFTLYEYFISDKVGHLKNIEASVDEVHKLEIFLEAVIKGVDLKKTTIIVTSDHGNIEDASTKAHTKNPVPVIFWGEKAGFFKNRIKSIKDITPSIVDFFLQM